MIVLRVALVVVCATAVLLTLLSAARTVVVPRGAPVILTRLVFQWSRRLFGVAVRPLRTWEATEHVMSAYAPVTLLCLPFVWLTVIFLAYWGIFWAVQQHGVRDAWLASGSSLLTLGFHPFSAAPSAAVSFSEAALGLGMLALLLTYLPALYQAFQRREAQVAMMEVRAGSPPTPGELFVRATRIDWLDRLPELWALWQEWFIDIEESHTSVPALVFFRSPFPSRSWVTAAGCVLDAASLRASALDLPRDAEAELCVRTGYLALRRIADYFDVPYDADPAPGDPISVGRAEFDAVLDTMAAAGVPVHEDRDAAWVAFSGWRVNYDTVLLVLAGLTMAPPAPWSSDRSLAYRGPRIVFRRPQLLRR